jgi:hypothetical protein
MTAISRGCVKTLTKIFGQKIDRLERTWTLPFCQGLNLLWFEGIDCTRTFGL